MHFIKAGNQKIVLKFSQNDIKDGLTFFSENNDFIQVGSWNYKKGKKLLSHSHNFVKREVNMTQEFIYVVKGSIKAFIYDDNDKLLDNFILNPNEGLILFTGGHGYEILEDDTVVIEVKNGPYAGPDVDKRRLGIEG